MPHCAHLEHGTPQTDLEGCLEGNIPGTWRALINVFLLVPGHSPNLLSVAPLLQEGEPDESTEQVKKRELGILRTERGVLTSSAQLTMMGATASTPGVSLQRVAQVFLGVLKGVYHMIAKTGCPSVTLCYLPSTSAPPPPAATKTVRRVAVACV